jgi:hypothetical protein
MSLRIGKIDGFTYPKSFLKTIELNLIDFDLWYLMDEAQVLQKMRDFKKDILKDSLSRLLEEMIMMISPVLKSEKEKEFTLFMTFLRKVMSKEENMRISGSG